MTTIDSQKSLLEFILDTEFKCDSCRQPGLYYDSSLDDIARLWFLGGCRLSHEEIDRRIKKWIKHEVNVDDANHWKREARDRATKDRNLALYIQFKHWKQSKQSKDIENLTGPRAEFLRSSGKALLPLLLQSTTLIPPLANLVVGYCPHPRVRYLHVMKETIRPPDVFFGSRPDEFILRKWTEFLQGMDVRVKQSREWKSLSSVQLISQYYLPVRWNAFPHTKRIEYVSNAIDRRMDRTAPQLGIDHGTWSNYSQRHKILSRNTVLCRECIFAVATTDKEACPWLFDEDLFEDPDAFRWGELYDDYMCHDFETTRRDVELTLKVI